ncbi:sensor histidine kinase [Lachnoanaerobaculum saburreum]|uniref:histidine kinase n=1 Tax=Lachnoanaerobaculum saburreum DSM 3986 TaxID=887325 RepID=E6LJR0_9FIRM|nr:HAMP domain-containing sensor histidine kinase [Lachnoanaerobaculum saburreum]EFU77924.1 ATPase/histidine kinase/DNA gyrase B/HSP90 domain protein [Lachnoanaerobaculum saburreum DSM 3986]
MKNKDALKLFFSDNAFICLIVFLTQFFFFGILFMVKGIWFEEIFYFVFLVFFMLTLFILIRFYKVGRVYEKLLLKSKLLNDYIIEEPRSDFEKNYNLMIDEIIKISSDKEIAQKQDKKIQKLMIYRFVHQMKTPLSVLKLIYENNGDKDDYKRIGRNINTLEYNLNQILNIYKLDDFKNDFVSEKVFLKNVCKDSINDLKDYFISSQIYPKLDIEDDIYVYSDSKWLKLIIHQILTNAIKYSNSNRSVNVTAKKKGDRVYLSIIDYGIGIEKADLKSIFELFYIGKNGRNNADSSGIGLYIVKKVSEYLGHKLEVESDINKGTTITVIFQ